MISWCCYCQQIMKEKPPLNDFTVSHGICQPCGARLDRYEDMEAGYEVAIRLQRAVFAAAREGDRTTCAGVMAQALAAGLRPASVLLGLVQPALAKIGQQWECGEATVADEHRFTAWCETMLALMELPPTDTSAPLDLLIVAAPGSRHTLGLRIAEKVLLADQIRVLAIAEELPVAEVLRLALDRRAAWVGFSCSLAPMVDAALEVADELKRGGYRGNVLLSGQAVRQQQLADTYARTHLCPTIDNARELILGSQLRLSAAG